MTDRIPGVMADTCVRLFGRGEAFDSEGLRHASSPIRPCTSLATVSPASPRPPSGTRWPGSSASVDALYHDVRNVWELGDVVFIEMDVIYWRKDGTSVVLPCSDILRFDGPKIQELRIFEDANPLFDAALPVGPHASVFTHERRQAGGRAGHHAPVLHRARRRDPPRRQRLSAEVVARRPALADAAQDGHPRRAPGRHRRGELVRGQVISDRPAPCCGSATGRRSTVRRRSSRLLAACSPGICGPTNATYTGVWEPDNVLVLEMQVQAVRVSDGRAGRVSVRRDVPVRGAEDQRVADLPGNARIARRRGRAIRRTCTRGVAQAGWRGR